MPTFDRAAFLPRAVGSLLAQAYRDWELVVVDDGDDVDLGSLLEPLLESVGERLVRVRHPGNRGLGAALNTGTAAASGRYLAYLPDDDVFDREHLARAAALLDGRPEVYLAFASVRWHDRPAVNVRHPVCTPLLRADVAPGELHRILDDPAPDGRWVVPSGNPLALVQVVHRRELDGAVRWRERDEIVSDSLEYDFWRELLAKGAVFAHTGEATCEWTDHPGQRHKLISGRGLQTADWRDQVFGLTAYRRRYRVPPGVRLSWRPAAGGLPVDEARRYAGLTTGTPRSDGRRILVAGALGVNPDRLLAFSQAGHSLFGTWLPDTPFWDTAGPLPFGGVTDVPFDESWAQRVEQIRPDVIWAQLGWNAVPFLHQVLRANQRGPRVPFVFHFKEGPFAAIRAGWWPQLRDLVLEADGRIFASAPLKDWFASALHRPVDGLVFDGEYPKAEWLAGPPTARLSDTDGEVHTVSVGRTLVEPVAELAARGIHLHVYTLPYMRAGSRWIGSGAGGEGSSHLHIHGEVGPTEWVRELSRYDAGWMHVSASDNFGEIGRATWADLNLPARIGTYAAAGLPWILRRNAGHTVATNQIADRYGVGLAYDDLDELAALLHRERRDRAAASAMRRHRQEFCIDTHVDRLVSFFDSLAAR